MRKPAMTVLVLGIFVQLATVAHAQETPVVDVATGYSFLYVVKGLTLVTNGGGGSVAFNANSWLGLAGDFGVYQAAPSSHTGLTVGTYALGPRFSCRKLGRVVPFGQILVGGGHGSELAGGFTGVNSFVFGGGGGGDLLLDRGEIRAPAAIGLFRLPRKRRHHKHRSPLDRYRHSDRKEEIGRWPR